MHIIKSINKLTMDVSVRAVFVMSLVVTTLLVALTPTLVESCPPSEWASLMAFKAALIKPNFEIFHSWRGTNCCYHWYGISCDPATRRVTEITLRGLTVADELKHHHYFHRRNNDSTGYMTGYISPSICNLTQLSSITISDWKGISGIIPGCIATLRSLQMIDLSGNLITGKIPWGIGSLTQLIVLNLADNHISGWIPKTLVNLSNLMQLDLRNNFIEGPIPWNMGQLRKLNRALLSHNRITGSIPRSMGNIYSLADIDLSLNHLSGWIPASLGRMPVLDSLNLKYNNLTGRIPASLLASRMSRLDLSRNALTGRIPDVFGTNTYFINLDLSRNKLSGFIGKSMAFASYIGYVDLSHNRLCGRIPHGPSFEHLQPPTFQHNRCLCGMPLKPCNHHRSRA